MIKEFAAAPAAPPARPLPLAPSVDDTPPQPPAHDRKSIWSILEGITRGNATDPHALGSPSGGVSQKLQGDETSEMAATWNAAGILPYIIEEHGVGAQRGGRVGLSYRSIVFLLGKELHQKAAPCYFWSDFGGAREAPPHMRTHTTSTQGVVLPCFMR